MLGHLTFSLTAASASATASASALLLSFGRGSTDVLGAEVLVDLASLAWQLVPPGPSVSLPLPIPPVPIFAGLTLLWQLLDEADKKFDWVNKVSNFLVDLGIMGPRTTEPDALKGMNVQQGFKRFDPNAPPAFLAKPLPKTAAPMATWNPSMGVPAPGSGVMAPGGGTP